MVTTDLTVFDVAFTRLLGSEGKYSNDLNDPGGETNWGISKRSYPDVDIKLLTRDQAKAIYKTDFWDKIGADKIPSIISYQLFDFAVNSGIETAVRYLQRALGVADDGHWGPISQAAVTNADEHFLVLVLSAERLDYMTRCSNWAYNSRGWARRIATNLRYAAGL